MRTANRKNVQKQQQQQRTQVSGNSGQVREAGSTGTNNHNKNNTNRSPNQRQNQALNEFDPEKEMTFEDLKYAFSAIELTSWLKIVPAELDRKSKLARIYPDEKMTRKRKFLYGIWQVFVRIRITILIFMAVQSILNFNESTSMIKILGHFLTIFVTFSSIGLYFGYFEATAHNMTTVVTILNGLAESLKKSSSQYQNENQNQNVGISWKNKFKKLVKSNLKRPLSVSLLIYLPFVIYSMMSVPNGLLLLDPDSPILLSSQALSFFGPGMFRTFAYIVLIVVDNLYYFFTMSEIYIAVFFMLFFIIQIQKETDISIQKLRLPNADADGLEEATKSLQVIKLLILWFNLTMSTIIYLTKLITLAGAIIGGFLVIHVLHSHPLFTLPFALMFIEGNVVHTVLFDNVYQITRKVEQLKEEILIKAQNTNNFNTNFREWGKKEEYKKICRSVQRLGIQAGGFYLMERESTLIFEDFVLQQIVDLLLTFS